MKPFVGGFFSEVIKVTGVFSAASELSCRLSYVIVYLEWNTHIWETLPYLKMQNPDQHRLLNCYKPVLTAKYSSTGKANRKPLVSHLLVNSNSKHMFNRTSYLLRCYKTQQMSESASTTEVSIYCFCSQLHILTIGFSLQIRHRIRLTLIIIKQYNRSQSSLFQNILLGFRLF